MKDEDNTEERLEMEITIQEKLAYLAGLIDGEGCIRVSNSKANAKAKLPSYKVNLWITNTNLEVMEWLVTNFGGSYTKKHCSDNEKHSVSWNWRVSCDKAGHIIGMVKPYLIIKKRQAEIVLAYRKIQKLGIQTFYGYSPIPRELRKEIFEAVAYLNKRGPVSVETNTPDINKLLMKIESELVRNSEREISDNLSVKRDQLIFKL